MGTIRTLIQLSCSLHYQHPQGRHRCDRVGSQSNISCLCLPVYFMVTTSTQFRRTLTPGIPTLSRRRGRSLVPETCIHTCSCLPLWSARVWRLVMRSPSMVSVASMALLPSASDTSMIWRPRSRTTAMSSLIESSSERVSCNRHDGGFTQCHLLLFDCDQPLFQLYAQIMTYMHGNYALLSVAQLCLVWYWSCAKWFQ